MKINYDLLLQEEIKRIEGLRPTLLLHVCCGPCSSNVLKELSQYFNVTIYYSNSNIYPITEYVRRRDELITFIKQFNIDFNESIEVIEDPYNHEDWLSHEKPLSHLPEKSERCHLCYSLRMKRAYDYAKKNNFDYWTTVLSVSPHKNSQWINEIGEHFQESKFLYADFKKRNGYLKSVEMTKLYNMYRQSYCGCEFSYNEMLERNKTKEM